ncbi:MAG: cytochrome-c peroxidase [Bacteroidia bacterium]|nr:cytochrome-c peroxidase [Bacteroidia bacterium]MCO5252931.1 cytochrome-c peroxidase [Bacteroidota bacterium]
MKKFLTMTTLAAMGAIIACNSGQNQTTVQTETPQTNTDSVLMELAKSTFGTLPEVVTNPDNEISNDKVLLGRVLFFDTRLSKKGNISCNSCHALDKFGVDNEPTSPGDDGIRGGRNSPTVLNAALQFMQFWDGRAKDVEEQAGGPILNPVEHNIPDSGFLIKKLSKIQIYKDLFAKAFPNDKTPITYTNLTKAIGAFERTLITPSRVDKFIAGDATALTDEEKSGFKIFMDAGCNTCHNGPAAGGMLLQKFGVYGDYWTETKCAKVDSGRYDVTKNEADKYFFKVPSLRNIEKTFPYFHDGGVTDLNEAVRIMGKIQLGKDLTQEQITSIVSFLKAFTADIPEDLKHAPEGYL